MKKTIVATIALSVGLGWIVEHNNAPLVSWGFVLRPLGIVAVIYSIRYFANLEKL